MSRRLPGIALQKGAYFPFDMRAIRVKLPDDLLDQLTKKARARLVTKSSLVREGLVKSFASSLRPEKVPVTIWPANLLAP
jgi:hypothetical protein